MQTQDTPTAHHHTARYLLFACLALFAVSALQISAQPTAGLVAHYRLDGNANNAAGVAHGVASAGVTYDVSGVSDMAAHFSGTGAIDLPAFPEVTSAMSVCFWGKLDADASGWMYAFNTRGWDSDGQVYVGWHAIGPVVDVYGNQPLDNQNVGLICPAPINNFIDQWRFFVATIDCNAKLTRLYVDGALARERVFESFPAVLALVPAIGGHFDIAHPVPHRTWKGAVDEVRLYSRVLSATEVQELYAQGGVTATNLAITAGPATVAEHSTNGYACTAEFSDGTSRDVSTEAQWSITDTWATPPDWRFEDGTNLVTGEICTPTTNITIQAIYRGVPASKPVTVTNVPRFIRSLRVADATASSLSIDWVLEDPSGGTGVSFDVEHRKFGEVTWLGQSAGGPPFTLAGLEEGTYYEVRVRAASGGCADEWAYVEPIASTLPGIYYTSEDDTCVVYRYADSQCGKEVPESAGQVAWEIVLHVALGKLSHALHPVLIAASLEKLIAKAFTGDDPTVALVSLTPPEDLAARAGLRVVRGSGILAMLEIDTRGRAHVVDRDVYLESLNKFHIRIDGIRLLTGDEAKAQLKPGYVYLLVPKSPLSTDTVLNRLYVNGGYSASFGGHHDQLEYDVIPADATIVKVGDQAELCLTGQVGSSNEVTAAQVPMDTLPALPRGVYPRLAISILPDELVFDSEAILTVRRQPDMGNFTTDAVIARDSDGVWDFLPTTYHANYTADLADDFWTAGVDHLCVFALCERETFGVSSRLEGDRLIVSWDTRSNLNYTLLSSTNLVSGGWQPVAGAVNVPGTGEPVSVTNSRTAGATFFKVRID